MASKQFTLESIGPITIYKRKGVRRINLRIQGGVVKVTQPSWLPYATGVHFAQAQKDWITSQREQQSGALIKNGKTIGKRHTLYFAENLSLKSKVNESQIIVGHPKELATDSDEVQHAAKVAIKKALKQEAEQLLPGRLELMAKTYSFEYKEVRVRSMHTRWGSCTNKGDISLNIYLMMLPWELIDYVLLHELTHTKHLHHGEAFWSALEAIMPDIKRRKKELKRLQGDIMPLQQI
jgi:predicted metal-dependent hydrolase